MFKLDDAIREVSTTTGAGTYTLGGAVAGHRPFSVIGANNYTKYVASDGVDREWGIGRYLAGPDRLERTHVLGSTNGGAAVNWGVGTRTLRCGPLGVMDAPRVLSKSVAGGAGTTVLTQDEQRRGVLEFTGALTGNRVIEVDDTPWEWVVFNNTSGAFTLTFKVTGQTGVVIQQGRAARVYVDGTDVRLRGLHMPALSVDDGAAATPSVRVGDEQNGLYSPAANQLAAAVAGALGWLLTSSGLSVTGALSATGLLDLSAAGAGQIAFPATQNASAGANTLDDYEEGTWTPDVGGTATYTGRNGTYTKIGRFVFINGDMTVNTIGTGDPDSWNSCLPFALYTTTAIAAALAISSWGATVNAMYTLLARVPITATTSIQFQVITAATQTSTVQQVFGNGTFVGLSGGYQAA